MLEVITIGRASVDLYGAQVGGRLEDMRFFDKYIGGSPTNIATGCARLGLKSALITRVGDEHMGRFIREELRAEGVDVRGVITDPDRLSALVLLGIRDREQFPLIFYREDCADMALCADDIDPAFIKSARCVTATGTHMSHPRTQAAVLKALNLAKDNGALCALDIDYRPNLWGLAGHGAGEVRFIDSPAVSLRLQADLGRFDLIVGTEEEFHIAGGSTDTITALRAVRALSDAVLVCKRGVMGATAFTGGIGDHLDDGISGPGFAIEVFNVLGAGDGFMAGLLRGWLRGEDWPTALKWANACGALAVSRHGCTPAYPSWQELRFFLKRGVVTPALRKDSALEQVHWSTNRRGQWPALKVLAFDHRTGFEEMPGATPQKIGAFKSLCLRAVRAVAGDKPGFGIECDSGSGAEALFEAADTDLWVGRPVQPDSGPASGCGELREWPRGQVVKVACHAHPEGDADIWAAQQGDLKRLFGAARRNRLEIMLEITPPRGGTIADETLARLIARFYGLGIFADWWNLDAMTPDTALARACAAIREHDPYCRGVVVRTRDAPDGGIAAAARHDLVKGFVVGHSVFDKAARAWMGGKTGDDDAVAEMAARYGDLCKLWDKARKGGKT